MRKRRDRPNRNRDQETGRVVCEGSQLPIAQAQSANSAKRVHAIAKMVHSNGRVPTTGDVHDGFLTIGAQICGLRGVWFAGVHLVHTIVWSLLAGLSLPRLCEAEC